MQIKSSTPQSDEVPEHDYRPTSEYTYDELADIYNQARVDYIVPMPMNGKRMREYVEAYDIDLDASFVSLDPDDGEPTGVIMTGYRDTRGWITRLGVIPHKRRHRTGQFLMDLCINDARERGKEKMQLEVIKGNDPARRLFLKLGFVDTRELLIIRRPPGKITTDSGLFDVDKIQSQPINSDEIPGYLAHRTDKPSWVEESASLVNSGKLDGFTVKMEDTGETGWVVFQRSVFQLTHFVVDYDASDAVVAALIYTVHENFSMQDTKIENLPSNHPAWGIYQKLGYFEVFARQEMELFFNK